MLNIFIFECIEMNKMKIALLLSYICIASISAAIITPALPQIQQSFQLSNASLQWVVSIFLLGYVFGQLLYAPLANRFGRLWALRFGLSLNLVGIVICLLAVNMHAYSLLLFGRLITALGASAGLACTFMLINELLNKEQAKHAMAYSIVSFTLGIGVAVTLGGIITQYLQWQDCFWLLLLHGMIMLIVTWQFQETLVTPIKLKIKTLFAGYALALNSSTLIMFSIIIGLSSAAAYCFSAAGPIISQKMLGLSPSVYGYWNLLNMLGMLFSGIIAKRLLARHSAYNIILFALFGIVICILSYVGLVLSKEVSVLWFFVTSMLLYFFSGMLFPCASLYASNAISDKANAASMMSFINMSTATLAVIIMGYMPGSALRTFIATLIIFLVLAVLAYILQCGRQKELAKLV